MVGSSGSGAYPPGHLVAGSPEPGLDLGGATHLAARGYAGCREGVGVRKGLDMTQTVGNTPIVRLGSVVPEGAADVWVKLEWFNPTG